MEPEEFKKLKYSKIFVDKLRSGVDPISGKQAEENEIIKNPRVIKCLDYISENLGVQIARELKREAAELEKAKPQFYATQDEMRKYQFSSTPLTITRIIDRINETVADNYRQKLKYRAVAEFLERNGYLEKSPVEGSRAMVATPKSQEIGMSTEKRVKDDGEEYTAILYNENAQRYIVEHIAEIVNNDINSEKEN